MSTSTLTESPCSKLPVEILSKIFSHCLSRYPLKDVQPDTKIAPMLLCHVCSFWRTVALTTATLWSHLHYRVPIEWDHRGNPILLNDNVWKDAMKFLQWWRKNHGAIPPFLRIRNRLNSSRHDRSDNNWLFWPKKIRLDLPRLTMGRLHLASREERFLQFLREYLSSAQYLDTHPFFRYLTSQAAANLRSYIVCPNLHTLVTSYPTHNQGHSLESPIITAGGDIPLAPPLPSIPLQLPPTLRRLSLNSCNLEHQLAWVNNLTNWSTLTHLKLDVACALSDWFLIIRAVPGLQWGHFYICLSEDIFTNYTQPTKFSLPTLSKLFLQLRSPWNIPLDSPLRGLFDNLEFPALQDLHLSTNASTWWDSRSATDIIAALRCTPVLAKLTLQRGWDNFLGVEASVGPVFCPLSTSHFNPLLTHLQLHLPCPYIVHDLAHLGEQFVEEIFRPRPWLNLESPSSAIRTVTIVIGQRESKISEDDSLLKSFVVENVRKNISKAAVDVVFKVRSEHDPGLTTLLNETMERWGA